MDFPGQEVIRRMITTSPEQKNSTHVRAILGHLRYDTDKEQKIINSLYRDVLAPYKNFFVGGDEAKGEDKRKGKDPQKV